MDVEVRTSDGAVWPGEIALISADVVGISYPQGEGPPADSSERVTLAFRTPKGGLWRPAGGWWSRSRGQAGSAACCSASTRP